MISPYAFCFWQSWNFSFSPRSCEFHMFDRDFFSLTSCYRHFYFLIPITKTGNFDIIREFIRLIKAWFNTAVWWRSMKNVSAQSLLIGRWKRHIKFFDLITCVLNNSSRCKSKWLRRVIVINATRLVSLFIALFNRYLIFNYNTLLHRNKVPAYNICGLWGCNHF